MRRRNILCLIFFLLLFSFSGCLKKEETVKEVKLDPENPVIVTLWHYYNGAYQAAFDKLVEEFNNSAGKDLGIYAEEMPDLFSAYTDSALGLQKDGLLTDLNQYCSSVLLYLVLRSKRS